jgi:hypothetical protein
MRSVFYQDLVLPVVFVSAREHALLVTTCVTRWQIYQFRFFFIWRFVPPYTFIDETVWWGRCLTFIRFLHDDWLCSEGEVKQRVFLMSCSLSGILSEYARIAFVSLDYLTFSVSVEVSRYSFRLQCHLISFSAEIVFLTDKPTGLWQTYVINTDTHNTGLQLKKFLKNLDHLRVFLCTETQKDTFNGLSRTVFFTQSNFHAVLICTVHTVYKYKIAQYCQILNQYTSV